MSDKFINNINIRYHFTANCEKCFGLCCVALPYAKSADFALDKDGGVPCRNLEMDYRCGIHKNLRNNGFKGCTVYECFGAGQTVSQDTYKGKNWRDHPEIAQEMFTVFPIMQQLHEMLYYLHEALSLEDAEPLYIDLQKVIEETEGLVYLNPKSIIDLHVPTHRAIVNDILLHVSELVRTKVKGKNQYNRKILGRRDLIGIKLKGADLRGANLRGVLLIASDLRESDLRWADFIGADLRDADLGGANLTGSIFLTQAQINSANGNMNTKLPPLLNIPEHWLN